MEPWQKFVENSKFTPEILETYTELRLILKDLGHTEESIKKIKMGPPKIFRLRDKIQDTLQKLLTQMGRYGVDVPWEALINYFEPKFTNINSLIPLENGNNKRNN